MINYQKESELLAKKLNFIPKEVFRNVPEFGYFITKGTIGKADVVLRLSPKIDKEKKIKALREKLANDIAGDQLVAKIIDFGETNVFTWSIRKFYPEKTLAVDSSSGELFHNSDIIRDEFLKKSEEIIFAITENIKHLEDSDWSELNFKKLKSRKFPFALNMVNQELIEKSTAVNFNQLGKFFSSNKKIYFNKKELVPCVGDLSPANILIGKSNKVLFYDLEYFSIEQKTIDIAYLWNYLWRYPEWQKKIVKLLITNDDDQLKFRFSLIRVILGIYNEGLSTYSKSPNKDVLVKKINLYKKHICARYLTAAGQSFDAIMKVK